MNSSIYSSHSIVFYHSLKLQSRLRVSKLSMRCTLPTILRKTCNVVIWVTYFLSHHKYIYIASTFLINKLLDVTSRFDQYCLPVRVCYILKRTIKLRLSIINFFLFIEMIYISSSEWQACLCYVCFHFLEYSRFPNYTQNVTVVRVFSACANAIQKLSNFFLSVQSINLSKIKYSQWSYWNSVFIFSQSFAGVVMRKV